MKTSIAFSSADVSAPASDVGPLRTFFGSFVERLRRASAARSLRRELSRLDDSLLRDIGISEDEIWHLRAGNVSTPLSWH